MAALDRIRLSMSACDMERLRPAAASLRSTTTRCLIPSISFSWLLHLEATNFPRISSMPHKKRWAARSIRPEPQIPTGGRFSMVWISICKVSGSIATRSITPGPAIMPILAAPPSSAGPAAPAQAIIQFLFPRTTSAFVPTSTRMAVSSR